MSLYNLRGVNTMNAARFEIVNKATYDFEYVDVNTPIDLPTQSGDVVLYNFGGPFNIGPGNTIRITANVPMSTDQLVFPTVLQINNPISWMVSVAYPQPGQIEIKLANLALTTFNDDSIGFSYFFI